jgi:hypothetical protein
MKKKLEILACIGLTLSSLVSPAFAGDSPADPASTTTVATSELEQLKKMLLDQQRQIDELRRQIAGDKSVPATAPASSPAASPIRNRPSLGEVASTTPIIPPSPVASAPLPSFSPTAAATAPAPADESSPLQLKIGDAYITPVGFMDFTSIIRSTNPGTGIGTNFGSIPYSNTQGGALSEWRLSPQNSRVGIRVDAIAKGWNVLGYLETDFLGQLGNPPNGGLSVSSNPYPLRMRLYWVDVRKGKSEVLAGQTWSLMTPGRKGISGLPGDLFYSNDIDVNYQAGLVWGRIPEFRYVYHPNDKTAIAFALSNSEPYVGGGNGGSAAVLPASFGGESGAQLNAGNSVISAPALHPDFIVKAAFDPSSKLHFEVAGVEITNKLANPTGVANLTPFATHTQAGGGVSANLGVSLSKNFRLITNNYWSAGGGRYIFGQAPDFMVRANGDISLVRSGSTVTGFEATAGKTAFYLYYGGVYIGRNLARDANGTTLIGYGPIASDGQNRTIQEVTFGTNTTVWKDGKYGAMNLMFQYSYLQRNPWVALGTAPSNASVNMGFFNLRYTLPGSAPTLGK